MCQNIYLYVWHQRKMYICRFLNLNLRLKPLTEKYSNRQNKDNIIAVYNNKKYTKEFIRKEICKLSGKVQALVRNKATRKNAIATLILN